MPVQRATGVEGTGQPSEGIAWQPPGQAQRRSVTLRVDVTVPRAGHVGVLKISSSDERLTDGEKAEIQRRRVTPSSLPATIEDFEATRFYANPAVAMYVFASLTANAAQLEGVNLREYLLPLLFSDEAVVPHFNSPPSAWSPLRAVVEQASAIGLGVTWDANSVPTMVGAYLGGIVLVKFLTPIVAEAGNATAAGVSAKIRAAFGIDNLQQGSDVGAVVADRDSQRGEDSGAGDSDS
ncbi:hypothetical protein ACFY5K_34560 [Streptomyces griseofuscus]|uniref:hypothetical protein n=1 Tax=Streptomyces griseofuscus TaxID=146922 RepID=UPI00367F8FB2